MVFYMPGSVEPQSVTADEMTPRQIVGELDRFIVGQAKAKRLIITTCQTWKAVAVSRKRKTFFYVEIPVADS